MLKKLRKIVSTSNVFNHYKSLLFFSDSTEPKCYKMLRIFSFVPQTIKVFRAETGGLPWSGVVISAYVMSHYTLDYVTYGLGFKMSISSWPLAMIFDSFYIGLLPRCLNWSFRNIFRDALQFVEVYCTCLK
jgi:hypothetical protein